MIFSRNRVHIPQRSVANIGTASEYFEVRCSCGWACLDHKPERAEHEWYLHLDSVCQSVARAYHEEIAREYAEVFGSVRV